MRMLGTHDGAVLAQNGLVGPLARVPHLRFRSGSPEGLRLRPPFLRKGVKEFRVPVGNARRSVPPLAMALAFQ